jgi:quercetin dioxygenase-like cupin family protein
MTSKRPQAVATELIRNDRVIVTRWCFAPGAETGWHRHGYDYVVVPQSDGKLLLQTREGDHLADLLTGKPYFRNAGVEHNVANANEHEFVFVEVEIK